MFVAYRENDIAITGLVVFILFIKSTYLIPSSSCDVNVIPSMKDLRAELCLRQVWLMTSVPVVSLKTGKDKNEWKLS